MTRRWCIFAGARDMTLQSIACVFVTAVLASGGCRPIHSDSPPDAVLPDEWQHASTDAQANLPDSAAWWHSFNDPEFDKLVEAALASNNDLAVAAIQARRAQLRSRLTDTNLTPDIASSVKSSKTKSLGGDATAAQPAQSYASSLDTSYEVDLWGRLSGQRGTFAWEARAAEADHQAAVLSLVGTTANLYWNAGFLNERVALSEASIDYARRTLNLVKVRYNAGAVTELDVAQAEQNLASLEATHTELLQQQAENRNALAILFDRPPEQSAPEPQRLPDYPLPAVEAGVPAHLIGRRPDLRAAEHRVRSALANADATRAEIYPRFSLTGSLGSSSTELSDLLANPLRILGWDLSLPFLEWNTHRLNLKVSQTQYEETVVQFRQALYTALSEVENALSRRMQLATKADRLEDTLRHAERAEALFEIRYRAGASQVQPWLDAQEKARFARVQVLQNRLDQLNNLVMLYKSLGGAAN